MKVIKILYLYPDILDLYGDVGNIKVLKYRMEKRGISAQIDTYSLGDKTPDFSNYDIVFSGGGADLEQSLLSEDLSKYKNDIKNAVKEGVFFLLICGSYQLFGKYYKDVAGDKIPGLGIFNYYTEANPDKKQRCIGNIITEANLGGKQTKVVGFENHGGQTFDIDEPFGNVLHGNGNKFNDLNEGFLRKNVIGTYLHGPLLSKNPDVADFIISYSLKRKYNEDVELEPINDEFEEKARNHLIKKYLEN